MHNCIFLARLYVISFIRFYNPFVSSDNSIVSFTARIAMPKSMSYLGVMCCILSGNTNTQQCIKSVCTTCLGSKCTHIVLCKYDALINWHTYIQTHPEPV